MINVHDPAVMRAISVRHWYYEFRNQYGKAPTTIQLKMTPYYLLEANHDRTDPDTEVTLSDALAWCRENVSEEHYVMMGLSTWDRSPRAIFFTSESYAMMMKILYGSLFK